MNHVYRLIWSTAYNSWVVAGEMVKGRGKGCSGQRALKRVHVKRQKNLVVGVLISGVLAATLPFSPVWADGGAGGGWSNTGGNGGTDSFSNIGENGGNGGSGTIDGGGGGGGAGAGTLRSSGGAAGGSASGAGGMGGLHGIVTASLPGTTSVAVSGRAGSAGTSTGNGGGGGAGGYGAVITGSGSLGILSTNISGANGGTGGNGAGTNNNVCGGNGGTGGVGMLFSSSASTSFTIRSGIKVTGGSGGAGGKGADAGMSLTGKGGNGGDAIRGANLAITVIGTVQGGGSGAAGSGNYNVNTPGTGGNALTFTAGVNSLQLQAGWSIPFSVATTILDTTVETGAVVGATTTGSTNTLILGGDTTQTSGAGATTFDVSKIGPSQQYKNFNGFQKTGESIWALTGTTTALTPWVINQGSLQVSADESLGASSQNLTLNGGTLQSTASFSTNRPLTISANTSSSIQVNDTTTLTVNSATSGGGSLTASGPGTLTLASQNISLASLRAGAGTLNVTGKVTGSATVAAGATLNVSGTVDGTTSIESGAILKGSGTVTGAVNVLDGGYLANNQGSTLKMGTNSKLAANANINAGFSSPAGNTLFSSTGLTVAGQVNVIGSGTFGAGIYPLFVGGTLTNNSLALGTLSGSYTSGAKSSDLYLDAAHSGQINLINVVGTTRNNWDGSDPKKYNNGAVEGGSGTWANSNKNWATTDGALNGSFSATPGLAVFGGTAGTVTVDNTSGAVQTSGLQFKTTGYTVTGDPITLVNPSSGPVVISVDPNINATISANLVGAANIQTSGAGTIVLTGTNTYSGTTTVNAGTLKVGAGGSTGSLGAGVVVNNNALVFDRTDDYGGAVSNAISGPGSLSLTQGSLSLTGQNTYMGTTTITAGTLQIGGGGTSGSLGTGVVINNGALVFNRTDNYGGAVSNTISGSGGVNLINGQLTLTGQNSYIGDTQIATEATLSIGAGATFGALGTGKVINRGTLVFNRFDDYGGVFSNIISDVGGVDLLLGDLTLTGENTYAGDTQIASGAKLSVGAGGFVGQLGAGKVINNGLLIFNRSTNYGGAVRNIISGSGGVNLILGRLTLTGQNSYSGDTQIDKNTILTIGERGKEGALGTGKVINNGSLVFNRIDNYGGAFSNIISGLGSITLSSGELTLTGQNSYTGGTQIATGTALFASVHNTSSSLGSGTVANNGALILNFTGNHAGEISQAITGPGNLTLTNGEVSFSGNNTYTGATNVNGGSTFTLDENGLLSGNAGQYTALTIANNAGLIVESGSVVDANSVANSGTITNDGTITSHNSAIQNNQESVITTSGVLNGGIENRGTVNASGGQVNGAINNADTFHVLGRVTGNGHFTNNLGSTLSVDRGSVFTADTMTLNQGSTTNIALNTAGVEGGSTNGLIEVTNNLALGGSLTVQGVPSAGYYRLFNYGGALTGDFALVNVPDSDLIHDLQVDIDHEVNLSLRSTDQQIQFWDGTDQTGGSPGGQGGDGTWNNAAGNTNWTAEANQGNLNDQWRGSIAIFGAQSGRVTVGEGAQAPSVDTIQFTTAGYIVQGGQLSIGVSGVNAGNPLLNGFIINVSSAATLNSVIQDGEGSHLNIVGSETLNLGGKNTFTGGLTVQGAVVNANQDNALGVGVLNLELGTINVAAGTTQNLTELHIEKTAVFTNHGIVNSGKHIQNTGTYHNQSGTTNGGLNNTGIFTATGGALNGGLINTGIVNAAGGAINGGIDNSASTFNVTGTVNSDRSFNNRADALLHIEGTGHYTLTGSLKNSGTVTNHGILTSTMAIQNTGIYNNQGLTDSDLNNTNVLTNLENGTVKGNLTNTGALANAGIINGQVNNSGTFTQEQGTLMAGLINTGKVNVSGGAINGAINNSGIFNIMGTVTSDQKVLNSADAQLSIAADSHYTAAQGITNGGLLKVNGKLTSPVLIETSGRLVGSGNIVGDMVSRGTIAPGNSIGTLNIEGNLLFSSNSMYEVEIDAAGNNDKMNVTGNATIEGGSVKVLAGSGNYASSTQYTLLNAQGGLTGSFDSATSDLAFLTPKLSYDVNHAYLTMNRNNTGFGSIGGTPNQQSVGAGVESLGDGNTLYKAILSLSALGARNAFDQLSGEVYASLKNEMIEDSRFVREAAVDRLNDVFSINTESVANNQNTLGSWGHILGAKGHINGDGNAEKFHRTISGFLAGVDTQLFDSVRLGVLGGYHRNHFSVDQRNSSGTGHSYHLGLYGGTQWNALNIRTGLAYTWNDLSTHRAIAFSGFTDELKATMKAHTAQIFGEVGYRIQLNALTLEPFVQLAHVNLHTKGWNEQGGPAALGANKETTRATYSTLGLHATHDMLWGNTHTILKSTLGWRHAFKGAAPNTTLRFATGSDVFNIAGVPMTRHAAVVELGLDMKLTRNATMGMTYNSHFAKGLLDQSLQANMKIEF